MFSNIKKWSKCIEIPFLNGRVPVQLLVHDDSEYDLSKNANLSTAFFFVWNLSISTGNLSISTDWHIKSFILWALCVSFYPYFSLPTNYLTYIMYWYYTYLWIKSHTHKHMGTHPTQRHILCSPKYTRTYIYPMGKHVKYTWAHI